jgi:hypothetical protein
MRHKQGFSSAVRLLSSKERSQALDKLWFRREDKYRGKSQLFCQMNDLANLQRRVMKALIWSGVVTRENGQIRRFRRFSIMWPPTFQP